MQPPGLIGERAIGLFLVAFLAFNPPVLSIFSTEVFLFGVPLLYFYLFGVWGGIILLIGVHSLAAKARRQNLGGRDRGQGG
jgi:zinc transporter ZupT